MPETQIALPRLQVARCMRHDSEGLTGVALQCRYRQRPRRSCNEPADGNHTRIPPQLCEQPLVFTCLSYLFDHLYSRGFSQINADLRFSAFIRGSFSLLTSSSKHLRQTATR